MIRRLLDRLAARLPDPAPIDSTKVDPALARRAAAFSRQVEAGTVPVEPAWAGEARVADRAAADDRPQPVRLIGVDPAYPSAAVIAEFNRSNVGPARLVTISPTEPEIVAAWLAKVRGEYQPWARRHAHQLIDELIEHAKIEAGH